MKLRINREKVKAQIAMLKQNINELNVQIVQLRNLQSEMPAAWQGEAADAFNRKIQELTNNLEVSKREMNELVSRIERISHRISQEDQRSAELVNNIK